MYVLSGLDLFLSTCILYLLMCVCIHTMFICFTFTHVGAWQIILQIILPITCTPSGTETHPTVSARALGLNLE